jgi:hypothetical protein
MSISPQARESSDETITALLVQSGKGNREAEARLVAAIDILALNDLLMARSWLRIQLAS